MEWFKEIGATDTWVGPSLYEAGLSALVERKGVDSLKDEAEECEGLPVGSGEVMVVRW